MTPEALRRTIDASLEEETWTRKISVLGSTGSIGTQTLDFARARPDRFVVVALCAGSNYELLAQQVAEFKDTLTVVGISDGSKLSLLREALEALEAASRTGSMESLVERSPRSLALYLATMISSVSV